MRVDWEFKMYLAEVRSYKEQGIEVPDSIHHTYETKAYIKDALMTLDRYADGNAVPKTGWEWFDRVDNITVWDDIPDHLAQKMKMAISEINKLKADLKENATEYLVDGYTVTKAGRKRIRATYEIINKGGW